MSVLKHDSPEGELTLIVEEFEPGNLAVGFAQSQWHIHADRLPPRWGTDKQNAITTFVKAILRSEEVIGVRRKDGHIVKVWIVEDDPASELDRVQPGETTEMRYWDGRLWQEPYTKIVRRVPVTRTAADDLIGVMDAIAFGLNFKLGSPSLTDRLEAALVQENTEGRVSEEFEKIIREVIAAMKSIAALAELH